MKISNIIIGLIVVIIGALISCIDYFLISTIFTAVNWITSYIGAPQAVNLLLTILTLIPFATFMVFIALISIYVVIVGISIIYK